MRKRKRRKKRSEEEEKKKNRRRRKGRRRRRRRILSGLKQDVCVFVCGGPETKTLSDHTSSQCPLTL